MTAYNLKDILTALNLAEKSIGSSGDVKISIDNHNRLVIYFTQYAGEESVEVTIYDSQIQKMPELCIRSRLQIKT